MAVCGHVAIPVGVVVMVVEVGTGGDIHPCGSWGLRERTLMRARWFAEADLSLTVAYAVNGGFVCCVATAVHSATYLTGNCCRGTVLSMQGCGEYRIRHGIKWLGRVLGSGLPYAAHA